MRNESEVVVHETEIKGASFLREILTGLSKTQKTISPKFLYDKRGAELFEKICRLKSYYPTRSETEILLKNSPFIAELIGPDALLIEPGSGAGEKVRLILKDLKVPEAYLPIEISREILYRMVREIKLEHPQLELRPVCADFHQIDEIPPSFLDSKGKKVIFFPGSTIGNFHPVEAVDFLKGYGQLVGNGGGLLIGVDLKKNTNVLEAAYDDPEGVTAAFNLNLLERLNCEAAAQFDTSKFAHLAFYNPHLGRVEMHLVSLVPQLVKVSETVFKFRQGETIHTESSYKYTVDEFCELCAKARFRLKRSWKDSGELFSVYYFERI